MQTSNVVILVIVSDIGRALGLGRRLHRHRHHHHHQEEEDDSEAVALVVIITLTVVCLAISAWQAVRLCYTGYRWGSKTVSVTSDTQH